MTNTALKYYHVYGDSADNHEFYFGREKEFSFDYCSSCKKVVDREAVIEKALPFYKSKFSRLFYYTRDGVPIVSGRFVEIYQKYGMNGLTFILIPKLKHYYLLKCSNIIRFDIVASPGFEMTNVCEKCRKPDGAYRPYPYKMIQEDELKISPLTFYQSDIAFGDKHSQSPLLFATEDILQAFKNEGGRIFFERAENGISKLIDCKGESR